MSLDLQAMIQTAVNSALGVSSCTQAPDAIPEQIGELGRPVIVRSREAGVVYGEYAGNVGDTVHLKNARQMWSWTAAKGGTLLDCATHGVSKGKFSHVNTAVTVFNACALIDCTDQASKSIGAVDVSFQ